MVANGFKGGGRAERPGAIVLANPRRAEESSSNAVRRGKSRRTAEGFRERRKSTTGLAFHNAAQTAMKASVRANARVRDLKAELKTVKGSSAEAKRRRTDLKQRLAQMEARADRNRKRWHDLSDRASSAGFRTRKQLGRRREAVREAGSVTVSLNRTARPGSRSSRNAVRQFQNAFAGGNGTREFSAARLLGVKPGASLSDAQSAYRRLARRYHPDTNQGASAKQQARNNRKLEIATQAYNAYRDSMTSARNL